MIFLLLSLVLIFIASTLLLEEESIFVKIAVAISAFLGFLGLVPFVLREYLGINYSHSSFEMFIFSLSLAACLMIYKRKYLPKIINKKLLKRPSAIIILISVFLGIALLKGYFMTVRGWDAYAMYDARAKFFLDGISLKGVGIFSPYDYSNQYYYLSYPPMTSVIHTVLYSSGFASPMITYGLFYSALFLFCFDYFKRARIKALYKLIFFLAVVLSPHIFGHLGIAYTNLPTTSFQLGALVLLLRFIKTDKLKYLLLSGLFIAFFRWIRFAEPVYWLFILTLAFSLIMKKLKLKKIVLYVILYIALTFSVKVLWQPYLDLVNKFSDWTPTNYLIIDDLIKIKINDVIEIIRFVSKSLAPLSHYFLISLTVLLLALFRKVKLRVNDVSLLIFLILFGGMVVAGTFIFSVTRDFWKELSFSLLRSSTLLIPVTMFFSVSLLERMSKRNGK